MEKLRCSSITIHWKTDLPKGFTPGRRQVTGGGIALDEITPRSDKDGFNVDGPLAELTALIN